MDKVDFKHPPSCKYIAQDFANRNTHLCQSQFPFCLNLDVCETHKVWGKEEEKMSGWACTTPVCLELESTRCVDSAEEPSPRAEPTLKYCIYFWGKKKRKCNSKRNMNHRALLWANESIPSAFQRHQKHGLKFHLNIVENRDTRLNCKKVMAFLVKIECALLGVIFSEYYAHGNVRKILNILSL